MNREMPMETRDVTPRPRSSWPILVLVCGLCGVVLYFAHSVFVPIALALLIALVLSGPVEALHRWGVPRGVSALLILVLSLALAGGAIDLAWKPAQHWFATAPDTLQTIKQRITPLARFMRHLDELRGSADNLTGVRPTGGVAARPAMAVESPTSGSVCSRIGRDTSTLSPSRHSRVRAR